DLNALPVEQAESGVFRCCCDGEIFPTQRLDQPILKAVHHDLPTAKFGVDLGMDFSGLVQCEAVAMRRVADHDVAASSAESVGEALHLGPRCPIRDSRASPGSEPRRAP